MKFLLTSGGITNATIADALARLMSKPFAEARLVFIPTAADIEVSDKSWLINDLKNCHALGWKEIDIFNLAATPQEKAWRPRLESSDVILFGGGNTFYLMYWLTKSGLAAALPDLLKTRVYVGISAGSIATAPTLALSSSKRRDTFELYYEESDAVANEVSAVEKGLGLVNLHIRPHLNSDHFLKVRAEYLAEAVKAVSEPVYAIDDQSAVEVVDGKATIVSEGKYLIFNI